MCSVIVILKPVVVVHTTYKAEENCEESMSKKNMNVYTESCLLVLDTYRNSFHCFAGLHTGVIVCSVCNSYTYTT